MSYLTHHIKSRMNQRGITKNLVACVVEFGEIYQDKYIINQKMANDYIKAIQQELKKRQP